MAAVNASAKGSPPGTRQHPEGDDRHHRGHGGEQEDGDHDRRVDGTGGNPAHQPGGPNREGEDQGGQSERTHEQDVDDEASHESPHETPFESRDHRPGDRQDEDQVELRTASGGERDGS